MQFSVVQQPPGSPVPDAGALVWRTCVRQVTLVDRPAEVPAGAEAWHDSAAYAHLLEVICGLHSPIVGETEVLHQFKEFAEHLPPTHHGWREVCTRLLADARAVRARHLVSLGSRSYGSAVRRYVKVAPRVALFGTGVLAREVLPYLTGAGRGVDLWGRRDECPIAADGAAYHRLGAPGLPRYDAPTALVVAAPMRSAEITRAIAPYLNPLVIIDLRAEGTGDPPPAVAPLITLHDVFAEFQRAAHVTDARVSAAKREIERCARAFAGRTRLNPSGWHDLCA